MLYICRRCNRYTCKADDSKGIVICNTCGRAMSKASSAEITSILNINSSKDESSDVIHHRKICEELNRLYKAKNSDYGDSCHQTYVEEGMATFRVRLSDKLNRFKILTSGKSSRKVSDESVRDTLIDLINYSIMAIMEIDDATDK